MPTIIRPLSPSVDASDLRSSVTTSLRSSSSSSSSSNCCNSDNFESNSDKENDILANDNERKRKVSIDVPLSPSSNSTSSNNFSRNGSKNPKIASATDISTQPTSSNPFQLQHSLLSKLSQEQRSHSILLLDEFIVQSYKETMATGSFVLVYINDPSMNGMPESIPMYRFHRILMLVADLRKKLANGVDNNPTQQMKYSNEAAYNDVICKRKAMERDIESICKYLNASPCQLGFTTHATRFAAGSLVEVSASGQRIDWDPAKNNDGQGRLVCDKYRRWLDGMETSDKFSYFEGEIKCIVFTEDLGIYASLLAICQDLKIFVACTRGFSDRNIRALLKFIQTKFVDAPITGIVDLDLYGLRQLQCTHSNEKLTTKSHTSSNQSKNYAFESLWMGPYPSDLDELLKRDKDCVQTTQMNEKTIGHLSRFIEKSAFPVCGKPERRKEELALFKRMRKICKMQQFDRVALINDIVRRIRNGDYGI